MLRFYRYCFFRLWLRDKRRGYSHSYARERAVALMSIWLVIHGLAVLLIGEAMQWWELLRNLDDDGPLGLVLAVASGIAHHFGLPPKDGFRQLSKEFGDESSRWLTLGYRLYVVGTPIYFLGLMLVVGFLGVFDAGR